MKMQLLPSGPAVAAALGLITIQVAIGIIMKIAQTGGSYSFSTSGSVSISEFFKLLLSLALFRRECLQRVADGVQPRANLQRDDYLPISTTTASGQQTNAHSHDEHEATEDSKPCLADEGDGDLPDNTDSRDTSKTLDVRTFWNYFRSELTPKKKFGFYILALAYTLINNSIFLSYHLADPGTIQLIKTGGTLITAIIMVTALQTSISGIQWAAVFIQMFGLVLTQYKPGTGSAYPASTYAILVFQLFLSASSSVYNQHLLKTNGNSLHADNMVLYAVGTVMNLLCHLIIFLSSPNEPSFFQGYDDFRAILVILSNIFIGLAITSVYKYADAVVKCFATAVATGILLYLSPIIFGAELGRFVTLGTFIVFLASGLYIAFPTPRSPSRPTSTVTTSPSEELPKYYGAILGLSTLCTIGLVAFMASLIGQAPTKPALTTTVPFTQNTTTSSPFHDMLGMVRWNSAHKERIPYIKKYEPFFDSIHISMPLMNPELPKDAHSWTEDQYEGTFTIYHQVSLMMQMALAEKPNIKGLMYFHFDSWLDPFGFNSTDWNDMWFAEGHPHYKCMKDTKDAEWWGWAEPHNLHHAAKKATKAVDQWGLDYRLDPDEWCLGWSDIYYIPRRLFSDYILLAKSFKQFDVFHELAIPTIAHIIDSTERRRSNATTLNFFEDCWGSCCDTVKDTADVLSARCGHRLDYLNEPVVEAYYEKLDAQAATMRA